MIGIFRPGKIEGSPPRPSASKPPEQDRGYVTFAIVALGWAAGGPGNRLPSAVGGVQPAPTGGRLEPDDRGRQPGPADGLEVPQGLRSARVDRLSPHRVRHAIL